MGSPRTRLPQGLAYLEARTLPRPAIDRRGENVMFFLASKKEKKKIKEDHFGSTIYLKKWYGVAVVWLNWARM